MSELFNMNDNASLTFIAPIRTCSAGLSRFSVLWSAAILSSSIISRIVGMSRIFWYGSIPNTLKPFCSKPFFTNPDMRSYFSGRTLLTTTPARLTPSLSRSALLSMTSSIGLPTPPEDIIMTFASKSLATVAFERLKTLPTPAWPVPSMITRSLSLATFSYESFMSFS